MPGGPAHPGRHSSSHYRSFQTRYTWVPREFEWVNYKGNVEDLIDNDGVCGYSSTVGDNVQGFTIRQIEAAVERSFDLTELGDKLKAMYPTGTGPTYTNADRDALFAYWAAR